VASGRGTAASDGTATVPLRFTAAGRRRLASGRPLRIAVRTADGALGSVVVPAR
jgi:hypothetical protein